jgi:MerR family transcriptional regulator, copper efflux regulator
MYIPLSMFIKLFYNKMANLYITIKQASKILGVSPLTLRNWDNNGKLKAHRHPMNNYRVYKIEDLEKVIHEIEVNAGMRKSTKKEVHKLIVKHLRD